MNKPTRHLEALNGGVISNDQLVELYQAYQPVGSGPLSTMRMLCCVIEALAETRGLELPPAKGIRK
jgi:hypothetical protein